VTLRGLTKRFDDVAAVVVAYLVLRRTAQGRRETGAALPGV